MKFANICLLQALDEDPKYTKDTIALSHWVGTTIQIRSEIRFDHSWVRKGYNEGASSNQFTAATDLIFHF